MPKECIACRGKDKRIKALIKGVKNHQKVILGLMVALIVTAFLGSDGLVMIMDFVGDAK